MGQIEFRQPCKTCFETQPNQLKSDENVLVSHIPSEGATHVKNTQVGPWREELQLLQPTTDPD